MKNYLHFIAIFFCTVCFSQTPEEIKEATKNRDKYLFAVKAPGSFDKTIDINIVNDEILIPVTIQGKTYQFMLDTGAVCILPPELKEKFKLTVINSNQFMDSAGNESNQDFYMLESLSIGGVTFSNVGTGSMDLENFSTLLCTPLDGIIGSNLMRVCNWRVDYENKKLQFSTKKLTPNTPYDIVDFEENFSGSPKVTLTTGGYNFQTLVDTGNNGSINISEPLYFQSRMSKSGNFKKSFGKGFFSFSGSKDHVEYDGIVDSLYVGNKLLRKQVISVSPSPMLMVGNDFLSQFGEIVINWKKKKIYLPKNTKPLKPEITFGFTPILINDTLEVGVIWEGSEVHKMGFEVGDKIISINGTDFSNISYSQWCELKEIFLKENSIEVTIEKSDRSTKTAEILKSNLF